MGKVHGSLTRAGKVRKQTPKVEKKDRVKKIPVGRAKRRIQYRKRYALIAASVGKKVKIRPNKQKEAERNAKPAEKK
jgi:small subunit ribosomal protein S30e